MKLSIIIPCYNEEKTLSKILDQVIGLDLGEVEKEIIAINDGSIDDTRNILERYGKEITVYHLDSNKGKGSAVRYGLERATGDFLIIQDADLEYNPRDIKGLVRAIDGESTIVYGSRNMHHEPRKGFITQRIGVWIITKLVNILYGSDTSDIWTCYKLFPSSAKHLFVDGGFESEIIFTVRALREGYKIIEVPISHKPRTKEEGKKIKNIHGLKAIISVIMDRLAHLKKPGKFVAKKDIFHLLSDPVTMEPLHKEGNVLTSKSNTYSLDRENRPHLILNQTFKEAEDKHESGINWLKSFLKQFPKLYYAVWHLFCPVMMLANGPRMVSKYQNKNAITIDLGSGPERLAPEFINVDIFPFPEVDIVADATRLPFRDNSIDCAISESMFEHVPDASLVAKEMYRIVKPGGLIYVSAPFIHPYHASPDDYNRWTISGLKHMFPGLEIIQSGVRSGPWSALLMFMAYWLGVIFSFGSRKTAPFLAHVFMLILGPLKYLDYLFMKMPGSEAVATHLYILGRKKVI